MGLHHVDGVGGSQALPGGGGPISDRIGGVQGPVRLRYIAPPAALRAYIGSLYLFAVSVPRYADQTRADVPQLRFMLEGGGDYHFRDGTVLATPPVCLLGPTMGATRFELDRPARVLGLSLLPAGWIALHGGDADAMADRLGDMSAAKGGVLAALLERLRPLGDDLDAMAAECWAVLGPLMRPMRQATWDILRAVDDWLMGDGSPRLEALVEATGLSPRQIARLTNRYYGAPPKLLARKYRALRCSARIALDGTSWQQLCEEGGFYDQSHFIREIKHFIGLTPHQLQTEPTAVAQLTLLRRSLGADVAVINRLS